MEGTRNRYVRLIDGEGGRATSRLIEDVFLTRLGNPFLNPLTDSAVRDLTGKKYAFTTDSFVVDPVEFPGGDIGKLSICGTVNDLAAAGAKPVMLSASFILEEGLELERLGGFVDSIADVSREADVPVVCGDTKVVPRGGCDNLYITTAGVGEIVVDNVPAPQAICPGDFIAVSGTIGLHASSIIALREGLKMDQPLKSDCAPLANMVLAVLSSSIVHCMRDPTRGGLGGVLIELAAQSGTRFVIEEDKVPRDEVVSNICELYGYDPMFMACEGRMVFVFPEEYSVKLISELRNSPYGREGAIIGRVESGEGVLIETRSGGIRRIVLPEGAPLPRIC